MNHLINEVCIMGDDMMYKTQIKWMSNIISLDHEIMLLPLIGGVLCGHQTSLRNWVIIKVFFNAKIHIDAAATRIRMSR